MPILLKTRFGFIAMAFLTALAVTLAALPGVSADGGDDKNTGQGQAPTIPDKFPLNYPNLGSHLDQLVASVEEGQATAQDAAEATPMHSGESVAVTIYLTGNVDAVVSFLEDNGGDPRNVGEDYIEAYVPVTLLGALSEQPGVIRVREIVPPQAEYGPITSQGVQAHGSAVWNQAGLSGRGIKVGVIDADFGFRGYAELMGREVPTPAGGRCYPDLGQTTANLADCAHPDKGSVHGTAVAEAVMDIAPEVNLYIASPRSSGDTLDTVDWMASQGVSVIVQSETYAFDGPGDGTSRFSDSVLNAVDRAVNRGIIWVNSAGNSAQSSWFGPYSDADGDQLIEFTGGIEANGISANAGALIGVQLRWDDTWNGARTDLDLRIWDDRGQFFVPCDVNPGTCGIDPQTGSAGHMPSEYIQFVAPAREFSLVIIHWGGPAPRWVQVVVRTNQPLEHHTLNGSIGNPAESANPSMLAVGATHYWDTHTIADYSSRGPTPDGRVKPDIVGTACGATASYPLNIRDGNQCWFAGTSQAAPHVAGLAALVRQRFPGYTPAQVASYLKNHAEERGDPGADNIWGSGFARLPSPDRAALVALYNATGGPNWTNNANWLTFAPISQWHGVTTDGNGRVTNLDLNDNLLTGTIPAQVGNLSKLQRLNLTRNQLTGAIPSELRNLSSLEILALGGNQLTGTIPTWLSTLSSLQELYLWENELTGTIPSELGSLSNLRVLSLSGNQLASEIPPELGRLASLEQLYLSDIQLTGTIPAELGSLASLEELSISRNELTGTIPSELRNLSSLEILALGGNQLTGTTPTWLGRLANLQELYLWENELTGTIPSELSSLSNLRVLYLSDNQLTSEIPPELGRLASLERLYLSENQLTGTIPPELGSLANLRELWLSENQLTGTIPAELSSLSNLGQLSLSANQLTGEIPAELGSLANLQELHIRGNELTGTIPSELGSLSNLERLSLSANQLTGEIPAELGSLVNLQELYIRGNELTGTIPSELGSLSNLEVLSLSDNWLTGEIPPELGSLANLEELYSSDNQLTGTIPAELGGLANLREFWLWGNQLTGEIPAELGSSSNLQALVLRGNELTGEIPPELSRLSNLELLSLSDNQLTGEIPPELGGLANLEALFLRDNQLTGTIPAELGNLATLLQLQLSDNQLIGEIPAELGNLTNLTLLTLAGNQLTGCVPDSLQEVVDNDFTRLGLPFCPPVDPLVARYDANGDGAIDIGELFSAIDDYFAGLIDIGALFTIIDLYFSGPA